MSKRKIPIPESLSSGEYTPKESMLSVQQRNGRLFIGLPKERSFQENRVALTPAAVRSLTGNNHRVMLETGAGEKSSFSDHDYSEAGAEINYSHEQVLQADIVLKVAPPTLEEIDLFRPIRF